jgi:hypothetical protein
MKITRKSNETRQMLETIPVGSCFIDGGNVFMVIDEIYASDGEQYNTVCLETGELVGFVQDAFVKPVSTELIVEG